MAKRGRFISDRAAATRFIPLGAHCDSGDAWTGGSGVKARTYLAGAICESSDRVRQTDSGRPLPFPKPLGWRCVDIRRQPRREGRLCERASPNGLSALLTI